MRDLVFTNDIRCYFQCSVGVNSYVVLAWQGEEAVSRAFQYRIEVYTKAQPLLVPDLLTAAATLIIQCGVDIRYIHGVVEKIEQTESHVDQQGNVVTFYTITLGSSFGLLRFTQNFMVFQNKTATNIVMSIFNTYGLHVIDHHDSSKESIRPFCVQYRESDYDFITRLMEEEGILFTFQHDINGHALVLFSHNTDVTAAYLSLSVLRTEMGRDIEMHKVIKSSTFHTIVPSSYYACDYNYLTPGVNLQTQLSGSGKGGRIYDYPGEFQNFDEADCVSNLRIQKLETLQQYLSGMSTALFLRAGSTFSLTENLNESTNAAYFVFGVRHSYSLFAMGGDLEKICSPYYLRRMRTLYSISASAHVYENAFEAIPNAVPYFPEKIVEKPRIHSVQTAIVVGPTQQQVYCDALGRVKIQFLWDRNGKKDQNSSAWVRVSQNWAGAGFGTFLLPRVGMEVLVTFINGDPDFPLVTGCLYNAQNLPPVGFTESPWKSTLRSNSFRNDGTAHELTFDDEASKEKILLRSAKDLSIQVADTLTTLVREDIQTVVQRGSSTVVVDKGNLVFGLTQGDCVIDIQMGNYNLTLGQGGVTIAGAGNVELSAGGDLSLTAKGTLSLAGGIVHMTAESALSVQAASISMTADTMDLHSQAVLSMSAGVTVMLDFPGKTQLFPMTS